MKTIYFCWFHESGLLIFSYHDHPQLHCIYNFTLPFSEKMLSEVWPSVKAKLKEYGVAGELNLVS